MEMFFGRLLDSLFLAIIISSSCCAQYQYIGASKQQRQIIFEGNSLMNYEHSPIAKLPNGFYIPKNVYNDFNDGYLRYTSLAIPGRTQTQINASLSTNVLPFLRHNDIIVLWEGTNDLGVGELSAEDAFDNLLEYAQTVRERGAIVVVCTVIPRGFEPARPDLGDRIDAYNNYIRTNSSEFDAICDLAADPVFDEVADTENTTYYDADKIHLVQGGSDVVIGLILDALDGL